MKILCMLQLILEKAEFTTDSGAMQDPVKSLVICNNICEFFWMKNVQSDNF